MSAPPEANTEYSRGSEASERLLPRTSTRFPERREGRGIAVLAVVLTAALGALLILVSQFTALYHVHVATSSAPIKTVGPAPQKPAYTLRRLSRFSLWPGVMVGILTLQEQCCDLPGIRRYS